MDKRQKRHTIYLSGKVNSGETIEIRVDVTDISEKVPEQDKEVIESGVAEYRKEALGLVLGIPERLQSSGREFYIIRAHEGEHTLLRDLDSAPDTIMVSTDMFSSYAIAYEETEGEK